MLSSFDRHQVQITSLTPELTKDYDERTTLATYRLAIANVFALICLSAHSVIVQSFNAEERYKAQPPALPYPVLPPLDSCACRIDVYF